jgi:hypothetical protein
MFKRMISHFVPSADTWRIIGLCTLPLLITALSLVGCTGSTCTVTPSLIEPPASAAFQTAGLTINPAEIEPGEELSITATVANMGDVKGSYMAELKINDNTQETMQVIVDAGETKAVTFAVVRDTPGIYEVALGGLSGQFEVLKPATARQSFNSFKPGNGDSATPSVRKPSKPRCCGR